VLPQGPFRASATDKITVFYSVIVVYLPCVSAFAFKMSHLPSMLRWVLIIQKRRKEGWLGRAAADPARFVAIALGFGSSGIAIGLWVPLVFLKTPLHRS
jgi:hypothetical protein